MLGIHYNIMPIMYGILYENSTWFFFKPFHSTCKNVIVIDGTENDAPEIILL